MSWAESSLSLLAYDDKLVCLTFYFVNTSVWTVDTHIEKCSVELKFKFIFFFKDQGYEKLANSSFN